LVEVEVPAVSVEENMNSFRNGFQHFGLIIKVDAKLLFSDHIRFAVERIHQHQFVICDAESMQVVPGFSVVVAIADDDNVAVPDVYKLPEESVGVIEQSIEAEVIAVERSYIISPVG